MNPEKFIFYIKIKIRIEDLRLESINFVGFAGNSYLLGLTLQTVVIQKNRRKKKQNYLKRKSEETVKIEESTSRITQVGPQISVVMVDFQKEIFAIYERKVTLS